MLVTFLSQNKRIQKSTQNKHNMNKWSQKKISLIFQQQGFMHQLPPLC